MVPTFSDFFKSFYYSNTYLRAVDLSDKALAKHMMEKSNPEVANIAKELISRAQVKPILSEPLSYDLVGVVQNNNNKLKEHGFKLLSQKSNLQGGGISEFYSVVEHDQLQGWVIKSGAARVQDGKPIMGPKNDLNEMAHFTKEESLLRIEMANRIRKIAKDAKIDAIVPQKKLVAYANVDGETDPTKKYCILCEKIEVLSPEETVQAIKDMNKEQQIETAKKVATIVEKAGIVDATFHNIRLTREGKLAFIDTEPAGLMAAKKPGIWNAFFGPKGASVEKSARIGLFTLRKWTFNGWRPTTDLLFSQSGSGSEYFHNEIKNRYEKASSPKISKWKVSLSILSLGLIPLINAVSAFVKKKFAQRLHKESLRSENKLVQKLEEYKKDKYPELSNLSLQFFLENQSYLKDVQDQDFVKKFQNEKFARDKKFDALIEGVPCKVPNMVLRRL